MFTSQSKEGHKICSYGMDFIEDNGPLDDDKKEKIFQCCNDKKYEKVDGITKPNCVYVSRGFVRLFLLLMKVLVREDGGVRDVQALEVVALVVFPHCCCSQ